MAVSGIGLNSIFDDYNRNGNMISFGNSLISAKQSHGVWGRAPGKCVIRCLLGSHTANIT
jgi:hypothetical protein